MAKPVKPLRTKDKTTIKGMALGGHGAMPAAVDSMDGKVVRIRPLHSTRNTTPRISTPGRWWSRAGLRPGYKIGLAPFSLAYKKRVYSPNRIKYPLKRVDWDPNGERNPQNRGKSKYVRISWDEATDPHRRRDQAVITRSTAPRHSRPRRRPRRDQDGARRPRCMMDLLELTGRLHPASPQRRIAGRAGTGAPSTSGATARTASCLPPTTSMNDVTQHTDMIAATSGLRPGDHALGVLPAGFPTNVLYFWQELGKKQVFVSPDLNYAGAVHADKWIPSCPTPTPPCIWPSPTRG